MSREDRFETDRRTFLRAGAATAAAASLVPTASAQAPRADAPKKELPTRVLGKTGVKLTILEQGGIKSESWERLMRTSYAGGVRVFDTAKAYGTEPNFKTWFERMPEARKDMFLVTKDEIRDVSKMMASVDERLKTLGTDSIDLFFIHGLGDPQVGGVEHAINLVKSAEYGKACDELKKSGKVRFVGFSTHCKDRAKIIEAAAEGGIVDAVMLQYRAWMEKDAPLNRALDKAHAKGVGLISMKQTAGMFLGDRNTPSILQEIEKKAPVLKEKGLTPYQGLLHAIWTDERITCVCTSMRNTDQIRQNIAAALNYEPLKVTEMEQVRQAFLASGPTMCAECDGRCAVAAGTNAALGDITRFLTYHEHHGDRARAREEYAKLAAESRDWAGADLEAARAACPSGLDFARLLPEAERHLA